MVKVIARKYIKGRPPLPVVGAVYMKDGINERVRVIGCFAALIAAVEGVEMKLALSSGLSTFKKKDKLPILAREVSFCFRR